jgi:hypothetical protein
MYGIDRKSLYSPQYLLIVAVVDGSSGPVVTAAEDAHCGTSNICKNE